MKALHEKVNIVPVLAKADSLTQAEVYKKKMKVWQKGFKHTAFKIYLLAEWFSICLWE